MLDLNSKIANKNELNHKNQSSKIKSFDRSYFNLELNGGEFHSKEIYASAIITKGELIRIK